MLNFVLCDDNLSILEKLATMLETICIKNDLNYNIMLKSKDAKTVLDFIQNNNANVFILDINLKSKISGINLAEIIRENNKQAYIIFTTGHLEYALIAYKVKTFDYLPKPITFERLEETILRLSKDISQAPKKYIRIRNNVIVNQDDIDYIKKDGMKVVFSTINKTYEIYDSFNNLEKQLPQNFVRCHKSYIANINKIKNVETNTNTIMFNDEHICFIGPKYKNNFMEVLNNGNFSNNMDSTNNT